MVQKGNNLHSLEQLTLFLRVTVVAVVVEMDLGTHLPLVVVEAQVLAAPRAARPKTAD